MPSLLYYLFYSFIAILLVVWIYLKSTNKFTSCLLAFLILSFPILNRPEFMIRVSLGFDLYPTRLFFLIGLFQLVIIAISRKSKNHQYKFNLLFYEKILIIFIIISSLVLILSSPGIKEAIPLVTNQLVFGVMYFLCKLSVIQTDRDRITTLLIVFAAMSVLISIIQFFVNPEFFRISSQRMAFGKFTRANGFLFDEYDNGLFLTFMSIIVLFQNKPLITKIVLILFFGIGVSLTMHRGSWLIFVISMLGIITYMVFRTTKFNFLVGISSCFLLIIGFILLFLIQPEIVFNNKSIDSFIQKQIFRETLSIRIDLQNLGIKIIKEQPLGIGDFTYPKYKAIYRHSGLPYNLKLPFIVHNGYIASGVKYGILGMSLFITLLFTCFIFNMQQFKQKHHLGMVNIFILLAYCIINLTQDMSALGTFPVIIMAYFLSNRNETNSHEFSAI